MDDRKSGKLNQLLAELSDTRLVSAGWLRAHGYSNSLVARYVSSGWLVSPARGVYLRRGGRLEWAGVVRSLQVGEALPLHVGGHFALSLLGHEHYLRLGQAGAITLYGPVQPPGWLGKLPMEPGFAHQGKGPFDLPTVAITPDVSTRRWLQRDWRGMPPDPLPMQWSALRPSGPCSRCVMVCRMQRVSTRPMRSCRA